MYSLVYIQNNTFTDKNIPLSSSISSNVIHNGVVITTFVRLGLPLCLTNRTESLSKSNFINENKEIFKSRSIILMLSKIF